MRDLLRSTRPSLRDEILAVITTEFQDGVDLLQNIRKKRDEIQNSNKPLISPLSGSLVSMLFIDEEPPISEPTYDLIVDEAIRISRSPRPEIEMIDGTLPKFRKKK